MKIRGLYSIWVPALAGITLYSCVKKPVYPSEPVIVYSDFIRYGNNPQNPDSVEVVVSFTDNEGDVGLGQADTVPAMFKTGNIWLIYYYDSTGNGDWSPYDDVPVPIGVMDTFKRGYRIPPVLPDGDPDEPVKGLIFVKLSPFVAIHPRIKYEVFMYDKALHKSNTIETPALDFEP